jgi:hypothetical protein
MAIGLESFAFGSNQIEQNRLHTTFSVNKSQRRGVLQFGSAVSSLTGTPLEMRRLAATMRGKCVETFGPLSYNQTSPIQVIAKRGMVVLYLPQPTETLIANPEMWLALAAAIEKTVKTMFMR